MKNFWKILKILVWICLGFFVGLLCNKYAWINIDSSRIHSIWEVIYYCFSILGAIGTCLAVFVALEKDAIIHYFRHPELQFKFLEEEGFSEEIDTEQQNPSSDMYNCLIKIENVGKASAFDCKLVLDKVMFAEKKGKKSKNIRDLESSVTNKIIWEDDVIEIPPNIPKEVQLFYIKSPESSVTPTDETKSKAHLELNGLSLKEDKASSGYWELFYHLTYNKGEHRQFVVQVEWNGIWKTRKMEMKEILHISLKENK